MTVSGHRLFSKNMSFEKFCICLIVFIAICDNVAAPPPPTSIIPDALARRGKSDFIDFIILHNNDMHARFEQTGVFGNDCSKADIASNKCYGGFARVAYEVRKYRKAADDGTGLPVLYLNAGDTYTGTPWFSLFKENITSDFMNELQPDAISLGNHEFDEGVASLAPFLNKVNFPVLVSNFDLHKVPKLAEAKMLKNSTILTVANTRIGVIGYLTPETKFLTPVNDVEFLDEIPSINKEAAALKASGVNIIIALGHSGFDKDKQIAEKCPEVDIVIGGHTNTFLYTGKKPDIEVPEGPYPVVIVQPGGKKVPVVQAYAYTKYLGALRVKFDLAGNLMEWNGEPILLNGTIPQEADVLELLEKYREGVDELREAQIGRSKVFLDGDSNSCRLHECNFGNLISDAIVNSYAVTYTNENEYWTDAAIGFIQGGGIRSSIGRGVITKLDVHTVLPFSNALVVVNLKGSTLREALEWSVHRYHPTIGRGEFLQMSGVHVMYNLTEPTGKRVISVEVLCADCRMPKYSPLDDTKEYKIVISSFLFDGGDGYTMFKEKGLSSFVHDTGDLDAVVKYIEKITPIYQAVEWRITLEGEVEEEDDDTGGAITHLQSPLSFILLLSILLLNKTFC